MTTTRKPTDQELQNDVTAELNFEPRVNAAHVGVAAENGIITLSGRVSSWNERQDVERAAMRVRFVKGVVNEIDVDLPTSHTRGDLDLARAAIHALEANVGVPHDQIKVKVDHGVLSLDGEVSWHYQRTAAEESVRHLAGVKTVLNLIRVKPLPHANPAEIKQGIIRAFHRHTTLDANNIQVEVDGGRVILRGKVRSWTEHADAEKAAWAMPSVHQVENQLEISYTV